MKNAITYENRNGYLYPLLALPEADEAPIGKYGWMYLDYLKKYRRGTFTSLLTSSNLGEELSKFDAEVRNEVNLPIIYIAAHKVYNSPKVSPSGRRRGVSSQKAFHCVIFMSRFFA